MVVKWNLTRSLEKLKNCDILVLSVGKSGRTWLRVMINKYVSLSYDVPFSIGDLNKHDKTLPSIIYTHELWEHVTKASITQKILGKYMVPDNILKSKKVVLLYRDPRDVLVSLYYHRTKRSHQKGARDIREIIYDPKFGIQRIVQVLNIWHERLKTHRNCFPISYETLKTDTMGSFLNLLTFMGFSPLCKDSVLKSIRFSAFDNMKQMEASGQFKSKILQPGNPADADSFKVREGKIGGYLKYFSEADILILNRALEKLSDNYGYGDFLLS